MIWVLSPYPTATTAEIENVGGPLGQVWCCAVTHCALITFGAGLLQLTVFKLWLADLIERFVCGQKHSFLPLRGSAKVYFMLPVQHLQISKSAPCLRSCRGLQTARTSKLQHRRSRAVCACGWWMVGETASEITCYVVARCVYNHFLFLPSFQILPGIWKFTYSPLFPSAEQLLRTKGLENISNKLEGIVNRHW